MLILTFPLQIRQSSGMVSLYLIRSCPGIKILQQRLTINSVMNPLSAKYFSSLSLKKQLKLTLNSPKSSSTRLCLSRGLSQLKKGYFSIIRLKSLLKEASPNRLIESQRDLGSYFFILALSNFLSQMSNSSILSLIMSLFLLS